MHELHREHAGAGGMLLKDLGVPEADVNELVKAFQNDNYALVKADVAERVKE